MELYDKIIRIVDVNIVYCLIPMILTLLLAELFFKHKFPTKNALNLIRWFILLYTAVTLTHFLIGITLNPENFAFTERATGPYKAAYWLMFVSAAILPFTLLIKRMASKFWYVLLIAFCMKIGVYFEQFVIITTSLHRDYLPGNVIPKLPHFPGFGISALILQGIVLAVLVLALLKLLERRKVSVAEK